MVLDLRCEPAGPLVDDSATDNLEPAIFRRDAAQAKCVEAVVTRSDSGLSERFF